MNIEEIPVVKAAQVNSPIERLEHTAPPTGPGKRCMTALAKS